MNRKKYLKGFRDLGIANLGIEELKSIKFLNS